jgi:3-hydroxyisobutyrate dehydrogenase-like beta-hydroxyacid dehydrogenase
LTKPFSLSETTPIGLLGCGLVGSALARRLFESGRHVYAYDPAPEVGARIEDMGGSMLASEEDVANRCRCLIFSLPGATEVRTVVNRILPVLQRGNIIVDTTTGDPDDVEAIAAELSEAGVFYLDATLGGSSRQIAEGEGIVICGGSAEAFAAVEPMLRTLASTVFHTGAAGSGTRMKLAMNLVLGLEFARSSGIDPQLALDVLKAGPAYSRAMDTKGPKMLSGNFEPEARLAQHWKDVRLIQKSGLANGATLPLTEVHEALLRAAADAGWGAEDNSAIIKVFQRPLTNNVPHPKPRKPIL